MAAPQDFMKGQDAAWMKDLPMQTESNMEQPSSVTIAGHPLTCPHCGNDRFHERSWQLNTAGMTFFNLDWLNQSAMNYICSDCGRIEWFTKPPDDTSAFSTTEGDADCLSCGAVIPDGSSICPKCGWTYVQ
ncbi:MAG: hypothetical protein ABIT37_05490 [Luteolibacter sp.]